jgi:hypothetical protein
MAYGAIPERPGTLLNVKSNTDLKREEEAASQEALAENKQVIDSLSAHIKHHWESAKNCKWLIENRLIKCYRQKKGRYNPDDLQKIAKFGGSDIFMMITNIKCRTIESWMKDVMLPSGEKPWSISSTPVPTLPDTENQKLTQQIIDEITQIIAQFGPDAVTNDMIDQRVAELSEEWQRDQKKLADKECLRIEAMIEDELSEGGFYEELAKFIKDFSIYPAAFLKGPVVTRQMKLVWENMPDGGAVPAAQYKTVRKFKRVSGYDLYFSPGARSIDDGYLIERMRLRATDLYAMKDVPGFDNDIIDQILDDVRNGTNLKEWLWTDQERANLESRPNELDDPQAQIEALEYHGDIPAQLLIEWGMDASQFDDPKKPISCSCMMIRNLVPMVKLNAHPLGLKPYYSASFDPSNEGIWGEAPPELMEDCQRICNAAARACVNNMAIGSGPQVEVHKDRMDPGDDSELIYPWKVWRTKSDVLGQGREAVHFYQPEIITEQLLSIYNHFFGQASEQLGVPAYESGVGSQASGAGDTAHGLSMLMSAASKIIKEAIVNVDSKVLKRAIEACWVHMMLFDDIKARGDISVVARASEYLIIAETLRERRTQFLAVTNNPTDMAIIGIKGRASVLRETVKTLKMNENIVPTEEEMNAAEEQENQRKMAEEQAAASGMPPPGPGGPGGGPAPTGGPPGAPPGTPTQRGGFVPGKGGSGAPAPKDQTQANPLTPPLERMSNF